MLALQASIGALNDLVDAGVDSGRKPGKPIPRGAVRSGEAAAVAGAGLALGLTLAIISGPATAAVAVVGVGCGYAYDLRLQRTAWSWLPLAVALPLLPVYAWIGATGRVPEALVELIPIGLVAGAGLALGNGLVDAERDREARLGTAVVGLGPRSAWRVHAVALVGAALAVMALQPRRTDAWWVLVPIAATTVIAVGIGLVGARRAAVRERGWELEALGVALLGVAWLAAVASSPG